MKALTTKTAEFSLDCRPSIIRAEGWTVEQGFRKYVMPFWGLHFPHYHMEFDVYDKVYQVRPGNALLSPPNVLTNSHYPARGHHYFVHFDFEHEQFRSSKKFDVPLIIDLEDDYLKLNEHFREVVALLKLNAAQAQISLWHLLCRLYGENPAKAFKQAYPGHITNALIYVQESLGMPIKVKDIARYAGVSVAYLSSEFKKYLGKSPAKYILDKRMDEARNLLLTTNFMIKEVASDVGITDPQHFNKLIKKYFGVSPSTLSKKT